MKILADQMFIEINGLLQADNMVLEMWTDAAGKRHVVGESLLLAERDSEFGFEEARASGVALAISLVLGGSGKRISFDGKVSRAGMRCAVNHRSAVTFQIDEFDPIERKPF